MVTVTPQAYAQSMGLVLPEPGMMLTVSEAFVPPMLSGVIIHPEKPFQFDFILDSGNAKLGQEALTKESEKLIKYFLVSLTMPEGDLWVNLSPYEKDRIITQEFGKTEMGRDLLAQDYLLKQLTASLIYPEDELGKKFWAKVYKQAHDLYGTTEIPVNTFNKVWIIPDEALIFENGDRAFVVKSHLKVMLEEDYLAMKQSEGYLVKSEEHEKQDTLHPSQFTSQVIREVILPAIEQEINHGKNFASLRQIYNSFILACWYKKNLKTNIINQSFADQKKVAGLEIDDLQMKEKIYEQYLKAFKKGVYDFIREDYDPASQQMIPRKYFSGGMDLKDNAQLTDQKYQPQGPIFRVVGNYAQPVDRAMVISRRHMIMEALDRGGRIFDELGNAINRQTALEIIDEGDEVNPVEAVWEGRDVILQTHSVFDGILREKFKGDLPKGIYSYQHLGRSINNIVYRDRDKPEIYYKISAGRNYAVLNEARVLTEIHKKGIVEGVPVLEGIGVTNGRYWLKLKGLRFGEKLNFGNPDWMEKFSIVDKMNALIRFAEIIAELHKRKVLHNDIKPFNFVIIPDPSNFEGILIDYNISIHNGEFSRSGTKGYMPPETQRTYLSDIFSFGRVLGYFGASETHATRVDWNHPSNQKARKAHALLVQSMTNRTIQERKPKTMRGVIKEMKRIRDLFAKGMPRETKDQAMLTQGQKRAQKVSVRADATRKFYQWAIKNKGKSFVDTDSQLLSVRGLLSKVPVPVARRILQLFDIMRGPDGRGQAVKEETKAVIRFALAHEEETLSQTAGEVIEGLGLTGRINNETLRNVLKDFQIKFNAGKVGLQKMDPVARFRRWAQRRQGETFSHSLVQLLKYYKMDGITESQAKRIIDEFNIKTNEGRRGRPVTGAAKRLAEFGEEHRGETLQKSALQILKDLGLSGRISISKTTEILKKFDVKTNGGRRGRPKKSDQAMLSEEQKQKVVQATFDLVKKIKATGVRYVLITGRSSELSKRLFEAAWRKLYGNTDDMPHIHIIPARGEWDKWYAPPVVEWGMRHTLSDVLRRTEKGKEILHHLRQGERIAVIDDIVDDGEKMALICNKFVQDGFKKPFIGAIAAKTKARDPAQQKGFLKVAWLKNHPEEEYLRGTEDDAVAGAFQGFVNFFANREGSSRAHASQTEKTIQSLEQMIGHTDPDRAMLTEESNPGGIDFHPDHLKMQTQGSGVNIPLPENPQNVERIEIRGLVPIIFTITPITDLPMILGEKGDSDSPPAEQLTLLKR